MLELFALVMLAVIIIAVTSMTRAPAAVMYALWGLAFVLLLLLVLRTVADTHA